MRQFFEMLTEQNIYKMEMIQAGSTPEIDIELFAEADISQTTPIDISQFSDFEIWLVDSRNKRIFAKEQRQSSF